MDNDIKVNKFGIIQFAGADFVNWLFRVTALLEEYGLEEAIQEKTTQKLKIY